MTAFQRIALVSVLAAVAVVGAAYLTLRAPEPSAAIALDASFTSTGTSNDANHLGQVAMPDRAESADTLLASDRDGPRTIDWEDLVPADGMGQPVAFAQGTLERVGMPTAEEFGEVTADEMEDFVGDIDSMRALQPTGARIRTDLDGVEIRMAGYATPLGFDDEAVTEFLLVPWLGACIHTPPPAANQIVYASDAEGLDAAAMWEPIWITGTLRAAPSATVLADVGYRIEGAKVEPYR